MAKTRPFLEDGSQYGLSKTAFRRMRKAQKLQLMCEWFAQNYEDPAERTPYETAEGGYQWIWGGPYEARDVLFDKFGAVVPEGLIEEAANQIEADGIFDWAPTPQAGDYDESEPPEEPVSLEIFLDEPSAEFNTPAERRAREQAKAAVEKLRTILERPRPIGIGHNQPPCDAVEAAEGEGDDVGELREALPKLSEELAKANPTIALVKRWATPLRHAVATAVAWGGRKLDKAVDAGMTTLGKSAAGAGVGWAVLHGDPSLHQAFDAIVKWLEIAAKTLF